MRTSPWQNFDWGLLLIAILLSVVGLTMIFSATQGSEDLVDTWRKQSIYAAVGVVVMFLVAFINYRWLESLQWPLYFLTIGHTHLHAALREQRDRRGAPVHLHRRRLDPTRVPRIDPAHHQPGQFAGAQHAQPSRLAGNDCLSRV